MNEKYRPIFKANDIRGVYGETLDDAIAYRVGLALAAAARARGIGEIALGRDGRLSSPAVSAALCKGLVDAGLSVVDIGLAPTPALYFAAFTRCNGSGVMVTGSHNPKNYNGMKMVLGGKVVMGDAMATLRDTALGDGGDGIKKAGGGVSHLDIKDDFIAAVVAACPLARPLKVVVDAGNGAAGHYAPALFEALGCEVTPLFCEVDGNFPNHHPDPAQPENLRDAQAALAQSGASIAFAFDGDGDRLGVLPAANTPPVLADRLLMLYARDILSRQQNTRVVFDVKCSANLAPWVEQHGGVADMQPTGHAFIKQRMAETGAQLGGEMSGHFYFKENWYGFDDALFAAARTAAIVAQHPDAFADLPDSIATPELHINMDGKDQHRFMRDLSARVGGQMAQHFPGARDIVAIDGMRVEYADGFGLARASNTTPALVLRFEAGDDAAMERIKADFRQLLRAADDTLAINF